jgi:hypothetical protein
LIDTEPEDLPKLFESTGKEIVGNSDCGNILFFDEILDIFPDTKLVIIERPMDEVIRSLDCLGDAFSNRESVAMSREFIQRVKNTYDHLWIDFHQMNEETCKVLWEYCIGTMFNSERWKMLDRFDVQVPPDKQISKLERIH